ncbi:MAG: hypothetical protein A2Z96_00755 [Spirochaetes bacterium GWB1_48_6]|nr:MAG: hypothetical protein A2Z96_00755 [Spirochaetes bacterium GWB1_48_6]
MNKINYLETISRRTSVRNFGRELPSQAVFDQVRIILESVIQGPFGSPLRFGLLDQSSFEMGNLKGNGTYGMIKNARFYIAGALEPGHLAMVDFGYAFEKIILDCTNLGLGTCWMAGTFKRDLFGGNFKLSPTEILPAISPVGLEVRENRLKMKLIMGFLGVRKRKKFSELFFDGQIGAPLDPTTLGPWLQVLEAVQQGPSASNKQPWRILRMGQAWHFLMDEDRVYNSLLAPIKPQDMDLGIALCHFALGAKELNLPGSLQILPAAPSIPGMEKYRYVASWV